ncbi:hypothetical protein HDZ31DRAFT_46095, partial [Schizophyllum fasciatum]
ARLVAELALEDLADIERRRKRKARADAPPSDEELAMAEQAAVYAALLRTMDDLRFAESMDEALEADAGVLAAEQAVVDDRRYAEALAGGREPPARSRAQEMAERGNGEGGLTRSVRGESTQESVVVSAQPSTSKLEARDDTTDPRTRLSPITIECIVCLDDIGAQPRVQGPCGHFYCRGCVRQLVAAALQDESLWPLRCDNRPLPLPAIRALLDSTARPTFDARSAELGTPAPRRLYCPNAACSHFLGAAADETVDGAAWTGTPSSVTCPRCGTRACPRCKQRAHPGVACAPEDAAAAAVRALARAAGWQTCPGCRAVVELSQGCFHMTCRCRAQFCYLCAAPWKDCACAQWEEARLLETARVREGNQAGAAAVRRAAPEVFRERVARRVERLRHTHDCAEGGHRWCVRSGAARCENCHHYLDRYLLLCRDCAMMVCVRCARNRL